MAKRDVAYYLKEISRLADRRDCVYRGQPNASWPLTSGAVRRIAKAIKDIESSTSEEEPPLVSGDSVSAYHIDLLDEAKQKGFGFLDGRTLSDIELLAQLQHFGVATLLLDFSESAMVALYFACENKEHKDKDGQIFIVPYRSIRKAQNDAGINDISNSNQPLRWHPILHGQAERRMISQYGLFLMNLDQKSDKVLCVAVKTKDKAEILEELKSVYQISADTLFMDISGFAQNQSHETPLEDYRVEHYRGLSYARSLHDEEGE